MSHVSHKGMTIIHTGRTHDNWYLREGDCFFSLQLDLTEYRSESLARLRRGVSSKCVRPNWNRRGVRRTTGQ